MKILNKLSILLLLLMFPVIIFGEYAILKTITLSVREEPFLGEEGILMYIKDLDKIPENIEINPNVILVADPKYIERGEWLMDQYFSEPYRDTRINIIGMYCSDMLMEEFPYKPKTIKIFIYTNSSEKVNKIPETLTYEYITISGKKGSVEFSVNETVIPVPEFREYHEDNGIVHLSWTGVNHPSGVKGYNIYRKKAGGHFKMIESNLRNTSFKETVEAGGEYCYGISAVLRDGRESDLSEPVCMKCIKKQDEIITYPTSASDEVTFVNLPKDSILTIYTINSEEVFSVNLKNENKYTWYLANKAGNKVSSGVYIYKINSPQLNKTGKLVIVK
ncbi:MAG: hypothetical protein PHV06_09410 [bacterium]|nr:hypothetical protein [bacterium]